MANRLTGTAPTLALLEEELSAFAAHWKSEIQTAGNPFWAAEAEKIARNIARLRAAGPVAFADQLPELTSAQLDQARRHFAAENGHVTPAGVPTPREIEDERVRLAQVSAQQEAAFAAAQARARVDAGLPPTDVRQPV